MALSQSPSGFPYNGFRRLDPTKYTSLGDFINQVNKPDNRDMLIKTYGTQTITGFLQMTGSIRANGVADEVQYWEEVRLHPSQYATVSASAAASARTITIVMPSAATGDTNAVKSQAAKYLRLNDIVLVNGRDRAIVTAISTGELTTAATASATVRTLATGGFTASVATTGVQFPIVGNMFAQGTGQNVGYLESDVVKRTNPYMILKEKYEVTGSQATNVGWIDVGGGDYRWYVKSEMDTRQRFLDKREMMMILGQQVTNTEISGATSSDFNGDIAGTEGYFAAIEDRGIVNNGFASTLTDIDDIVKELDKQGGAPEYALYLNRQQDLYIDDLIARGLPTAVTTNPTNGGLAFGNYNNAQEAAIKLGFTSFKRGSYTFHKTGWKLLNEPTLLGVTNSKYYGVAIPMVTVADPKTGDKAPALEMNYKATNGYSREMEHWMTGSILGVTNTNDDNLQFNYRSEFNLVTRAANRHVLFRG